MNEDVDWDFWNSETPLKDAKKFDKEKESNKLNEIWNPLDDLPFFY